MHHGTIERCVITAWLDCLLGIKVVYSVVVGSLVDICMSTLRVAGGLVCYIRSGLGTQDGTPHAAD